MYVVKIYLMRDCVTPKIFAVSVRRVLSGLSESVLSENVALEITHSLVQSKHWEIFELKKSASIL